MSFSRKYRFHPDSNPVDPSGFDMNCGRRQRWPANDEYYGNCGAEARNAMIPPPSKRRRPVSCAPSTCQQGESGFGWPLAAVGSRQGGNSNNRFCGDVGGGPSTSQNLFCLPTLIAANPDFKLSSYGCVNKVEPFKPAVDEDPVFMSRDEIERSSPSRKDGIDLLHEKHLRYSYCAFLQSLGMRLELPQTTIGTSMVLCHRFFVRRSHACHDRFLIATAALFLAAKSEETPRPLNNVVKVSTEISFKQNPTYQFSLPIDWFEKYRERVIEAENMILTTLDFELNVQHPYTHLTSTLNKLGLTQSVLVNMAWNLISEGLRSSLWLQFKPHHIAAGAAFLAAQFLNLDLGSYNSIWQEFQTVPSIIQEVVEQLLELL